MKTQTRHLAALAALGTAALAGCGGVQHVGEYQPKHRTYELPKGNQAASEAVSQGSLWRDGSNLFSDARAYRQNDLVVVRVEEIANAQRKANTKLERESELSATLSAFLQKAGVPTPVNVDGKLGAGSSSSFRGEGSTGRTEQLTATVPALVRDVLPNGNLFIEGHRVVLVNNEEQHFYISGVVRPIDIEQDNSVKSSQVADAEVEFTGRGVLTDNQQKSVVARFLSALWPF